MTDWRVYLCLCCQSIGGYKAPPIFDRSPIPKIECISAFFTGIGSRTFPFVFPIGKQSGSQSKKTKQKNINFANKKCKLFEDRIVSSEVDNQPYMLLLNLLSVIPLILIAELMVKTKQKIPMMLYRKFHQSQAASENLGS